MQLVEHYRLDLDVLSILRLISVVVETVGQEWLMRKIREVQRRPKPKKLRKFSYLYGLRTHPLVEWSIQSEKWRKECLRTKRLVLSEAVLKMASLGRSLELAKSQKNFSRLLRRLKSVKQFDAAAFEVEVAASYVSRGWAVEFIEEGTQKSPDLKVTRDNGAIFWVECKRKDQLTERDRRIQQTWENLESSLLRYLGPRRLNYLVAIKARNDPEPKDADYLRDLVLGTVGGGGLGVLGPEHGIMQLVADPSGRFDMLVHKLAEPDETIETDQIGFGATEDFDRCVIGAEIQKTGESKTLFRNPVIIAFKTAIPPDRVSGVVEALRAATEQLPREGPGVVWVRIPDNSWGDRISKSFERVHQLLRNELTGDHNRRVNAVFVMTRLFQKLRKDDLEGLGYHPLIVRVEHDNPRTPVGP